MADRFGMPTVLSAREKARMDRELAEARERMVADRAAGRVPCRRCAGLVTLEPPPPWPPPDADA